MAVPPPTGVPPGLMNEYWRLCGEYSAAMGIIPPDATKARMALQQLNQLVQQNPGTIQQILGFFKELLYLALTAAGFALTKIAELLAWVFSRLAAGAIAALASPEFLILAGLAIGVMVYCYCASGGSPYGSQSSSQVQPAQRNQLLAALNFKSPASPFYQVEYRQLPPGIVVRGLS